MSKTARRLGRGLSSLVSDLSESSPSRESATAPASAAEYSPAGAPALQTTMLPIDQLQPNPFQPRDNVSHEDVISLAQSIDRNGLLQPITVRPRAGQYQIIAGERRWAAARSLGMTHLPAVVRDANDEEMLELALIENLQREDLNAIDRAMAYRRFCTHFGLKPEAVAHRLGEDRTTVINYLRLLDLPDPIRSLVAKARLSMGHARCLLGVVDDARRWQLAESVVQNDLSVRALEEIVRRERTRPAAAAGAPPRKGRLGSPHLRDVERQFERSLQTKVAIREGKKRGTGRIVIEYYSLDDFDRIASRLGITLE